jgi:hypothetical protein
MPAPPVVAQELRRNVAVMIADVMYVFICGWLYFVFLEAEADASAEAVFGIVSRDE